MSGRRRLTAVLGGLVIAIAAAYLALGEVREPATAAGWPLMAGFWDSRIRTLPANGDNWPATAGDDGKLYVAYGDGTGFGGSRTLSLGFASVAGSPFSGSMRGVNIHSNIDATGHNSHGLKASGLLMVHHVLYCFVRNFKVGGHYRHSRLAWSADHGKHWTWASWYFSGTFGAPDFVQYGPNYAGGPKYVYVLSQDNSDAYKLSPDIVLARVPANEVSDRSAWDFFSGTSNHPAWSAQIENRKPIFYDANQVFRASMSYDAGLRRYLLVSSHFNGGRAGHATGLGVFSAPEPWGPWATVYYSNSWSPGISYAQKFPTPYMSADGRTLWLLFSGRRGTPYKFDLRKLVLR